MLQQTADVATDGTALTAVGEPSEPHTMRVSGTQPIHESIRQLARTALMESCTAEEYAVYAANAVEYGKSMPFDGKLAEEAAWLAMDNISDMGEFPDIFQISYRWILDSGASKQFCAQRDAAKFKEALRQVKEMSIHTAAGIEKLDKALMVASATLKTKQEVYLLAETPALYSMGTAVSSGFTFLWNYGFDPCLISVDEQKLFVFYVIGGVPMMVKNGIFNKLRDQSLLETLTGTTKSMDNGEAVVNIRSIKSKPIQNMVEHYRNLNRAVLKYVEESAFVASVSSSALKGCASSADKPLEPEFTLDSTKEKKGIVVRSGGRCKGVRTRIGGSERRGL